MAYVLEILGTVAAICPRLFGVWSCDKTDVCLCFAVPVIVEASMERKVGHIHQWLLT